MTKEEIIKLPKVPGIYLIENIINGKCYVGQSINLRKRLLQHYSNGHNSKFYYKHLYAAISKYGICNFKLTILEVIDPFITNLPELLNSLEISYIEKYNSFTCGYNKTKGGEGFLGCREHPEIINKISESLKKYFKEHKEELDGVFYTRKYTCGYNYKEKYFIEANSRSELSEILKEKGYNIPPTTISHVAVGTSNYSYDFVFASSKEECLEKVKFFASDKAKHSSVLAPNYSEYLEYLKTIVDKNGYLPPIEEIANHYNRAKTTIVGWNKHISDFIELDKYYNRLKLIGFNNPDIDYNLRATKQEYKIIDTLENKEYLAISKEASELLGISLQQFNKISNKSNKLYKNRYIIIKNGNII